MISTEENIKFETDTHYVYQVKVGHFEVFENGITHAKWVGTFHYKDDPEYALSRAIEFCKQKSEAFLIKFPNFKSSRVKTNNENHIL